MFRQYWISNIGETYHFSDVFLAVFLLPMPQTDRNNGLFCIVDSEKPICGSHAGIFYR